MFFGFADIRLWPYFVM